MLLVPLFVLFALTPTVVAAEEAVLKHVPGTRGDLDCSSAVSADCDDVVQGTNEGAPRNVLNYDCAVWDEIGGEAVYELVLPGPDNWVVGLELDRCAIVVEGGGRLIEAKLLKAGQVQMVRRLDALCTASPRCRLKE